MVVCAATGGIVLTGILLFLRPVGADGTLSGDRLKLEQLAVLTPAGAHYAGLAGIACRYSWVALTPGNPKGYDVTTR